MEICTGSELGGKSVTADGDTCTINFTSDGSVEYYGFAFDSIKALFVDENNKDLLGNQQRLLHNLKRFQT